MFGKSKDKGEETNKKKKDKGGKALGYVKIVFVVLIVLIVINSSYYTIQEEEQAVVCTLGEPKAVTTPGLHFKVPFIQTVTKVNTTIQGFSIGLI